jgi:hypothetical protein
MTPAALIMAWMLMNTYEANVKSPPMYFNTRAACEAARDRMRMAIRYECVPTGLEEKK